MATEYVLGIDAGTSSAKVGLVSRDGVVSRVSSESYPMFSPHPGWTEQNAGDWWNAAKAAIQKVTQGIDPASVVGIGLSNAGGSFVALDSDGQPVRPAMVWMDGRVGALAQRLAGEKEPQFWHNRLGHSSIAHVMAAKLVWIREHEPEAFRRIALVLQPADYVAYRMTGQVVTDRSNACATGMYNVRHQGWDDDILSVFELSKSMLPKLQNSGTVAGHLTSEAAAEIGLQPGTPVVLGAWDQVCAVVGAGSRSGEAALLSAGTAWVLLEPVEALRLDPAGRVWTVQHARPDESVLMVAMSNGGAVVEWYRRVFAGIDSAGQDAGDGEANDLSGLPQGVEQVPPGSNGVLVLPHLIGAMGIHMQVHYSACVLGLRHGTGRAEIFRAILEAVAYEARWSLQVLAELGIATPALRMVGGGTRSALWPQIVADVTGLEVMIPHETECAVLGAARLAQEAVGVDVLPQSEAMRIERRYRPQEQAVAAYTEYYKLYKLTHNTLNDPLSRLEELRAR
jgi:xylulokinase